MSQIEYVNAARFDKFIIEKMQAMEHIELQKAGLQFWERVLKMYLIKRLGQV